MARTFGKGKTEKVGRQLQARKTVEGGRDGGAGEAGSNTMGGDEVMGGVQGDNGCSDHKGVGESNPPGMYAVLVFDGMILAAQK